MTTGRPLKTVDDLPKGWRELVISMMAEGASKKEVMAELNIGSQLFQSMVERDEDFSNTIKRGVQLSEAWWERQGRMNIGNKSFNVALWYINMKNRFGWKDKVDSSFGDDGMPIQVVSYRDVKKQVVGFNFIMPEKPIESEDNNEAA